LLKRAVRARHIALRCLELRTRSGRGRLGRGGFEFAFHLHSPRERRSKSRFSERAARYRKNPGEHACRERNSHGEQRHERAFQRAEQRASASSTSVTWTNGIAMAHRDDDGESARKQPRPRA
jgi:hypothetical protein